MTWRLASGALALLAGSAQAQPAPGEANPSFYLVNRSPAPISRVYATPAGLPNWGGDRLGGTAIGPGQNAPIRLPADGSCVYDVRVVFANGRSDERRGLNTCQIDNLSFPGGRPAAAARAARPEGNPSFLLVNRGRAALNELYLSPSGDDSWGEDRLGDGTLPGGGAKPIRLPPGECVYDMRAVFANGEANERRRLNLCAITDLRVP